MTKDNKKNDNWSLLASELGLEDDSSQSVSDEHEVTKQTEWDKQSTEHRNDEASAACSKADEPISQISVEAETNNEVVVGSENASSFGVGILDDDSPVPVPQKEPKKTLLGRFAKINLFGAPKTTTDPGAVPTKTGGGFTSKTVEKVPLPPTRASKLETAADEQKQNPSPTSEKVSRNTQETQVDQQAAISTIADSLDPWSQIASQVGALPQRAEEQRIAEQQVATNDAAQSSRSSDSQNQRPGRGRKEKERNRKPMPSLFDDADRPESQERSAFRNLIDETETKDEAEKRLESIFNDDESSDVRETRRGRPTRQKDFKKSLETEQERASVPSPKDDDRVKRRRGSRYVPDEVVSVREEPVQEETEEDVFAAWDIEEESKPVERSPRGRQRSGKSDRTSRTNSRGRSETENRSQDDFDPDRMEDSAAPVQKYFPSWDDAISVIIEANKARHGQRSGDSRRGRR